jgi:ferrous iron transport protein A
METLTLNKLNINEKGTVMAVENTGSVKRRMLDLGVVRGSKIECVGRSPLGDPSAYLIKGAVVAIRASDANGVIVTPSIWR